jgi:hypothetical protein
MIKALKLGLLFGAIALILRELAIDGLAAFIVLTHQY